MRPTPALLEREGQLAELARAVAGLDRSAGAAVLVEGPAGIGKTCLLDVAAADARARGWTVLRARGVAVEEDCAFGVMRQLLERALADSTLSGPASLGLQAFAGPTVTAEPTLGLLHGIYWIVVGLATRGPLVLVVDDLHWADGPSLRALAYLTRRLDGLAVAVLAGTRPTESPSELAVEPAVTHIPLAPLSPAATAALLGDAVNPAAVAACQTACGGNPFLVAELARAIADSGRSIGGAESIAALVRDGAGSLTRAVMARLGGAGDDAVTLARAVSVLGCDSRIDRVCELTGLEAQSALAAASRLTRAHILADAVPLGFAHPLLQSAVYGDLTAVERADLHRRAARLLGVAGGDRLAAHLLLTEPGGDPAVAAQLLDAGVDAAARGAARIAVNYLRRAAAEPPAPAREAQTLAALGAAELELGDPGAAAGHLRAALARDPGRCAAALALAQALTHTEGPASAVAALAGLLDGFAGDARLRLEVECASLGLYAAESAAAAQLQMRAFAELPGDTPVERLALATAALAVAFDPQSSAADALPLARRALADGRLLAEHGADAPPFGNACYVLLFAEDLDRLDAEVARAFADARARGSTFSFMTASLGQAMIEAHRGHLAAAAGHGEAALATIAELRRTPVANRWLSAVVRVLVAVLLERGEVERARAVVAVGLDLGDVARLDLAMVRVGRGLVAAHDGDHAAAFADFVGYGDACREAGYEDRTTPWRLAAARSATALGRLDEARALTDEAVAVAGRWGAPGCHGAALRAAALVGDPRAAGEALACAVEVLRGSPCRLELAAALLDQGLALRRVGQRARARSAIEEAVDLAGRCGAGPLVERGIAELRVLGSRPRRLMFSGVEALTGSERRVAALAAGGSTNREIAQALFVTPKTVESHLASTYQKLGIKSRQELPSSLATAA